MPSRKDDTSDVKAKSEGLLERLEDRPLLFGQDGRGRNSSTSGFLDVEEADLRTDQERELC